MSETVRLNKFLAERLGISRREADNLIVTGKIKLNGQKAVLGAHIDKNSKVCYNEKIVPFLVEFSYLLLHKPVGYVCSRKKQGEAETLYSLLPEQYQKLKTVGRLDKNSSGLIILTDDGDFAFRMTHPRFRKTKVYEVELDRELPPLHQQMIADFGIKLEDGVSKLGLERLDANGRRWKVVMSEGRNRQIRRTFAALGYQVKRLHRWSFGNYQLGNLQPGEFKSFKQT
ncbi:MAG: pseudouridine synthase [Candidatus Saccharibacteria bacterium]|nr:pseudouridine synthase [Candidatus Saccharibacteria bacterium]